MGGFYFEIQRIPLELGAGSGSLFRGTMPWGLSNPDASREYIQQLETRKIDKVIVLVTKEELDFASDCQYPNAIQFYESHNVKTIHYPMEDGSAPASDESFDSLISTLSESLKNGEHVLVHCMGGIGRTGLVISCLAKKILRSEIVEKNEGAASSTGNAPKVDDSCNDLITQIALERVRYYLPKAVETTAQMRYLKEYLHKADLAPREPCPKIESVREKLGFRGKSVR